MAACPSPCPWSGWAHDCPRPAALSGGALAAAPGATKLDRGLRGALSLHNLLRRAAPTSPKHRRAAATLAGLAHVLPVQPSARLLSSKRLILDVEQLLSDVDAAAAHAAGFSDAHTAAAMRGLVRDGERPPVHQASQVAVSFADGYDARALTQVVLELSACARDENRPVAVAAMVARSALALRVTSTPHTLLLAGFAAIAAGRDDARVATLAGLVEVLRDAVAEVAWDDAPYEARPSPDVAEARAHSGATRLQILRQRRAINRVVAESDRGVLHGALDWVCERLDAIMEPEDARRALSGLGEAAAKYNSAAMAARDAAVRDVQSEIDELGDDPLHRSARRGLELILDEAAEWAPLAVHPCALDPDRAARVLRSIADEDDPTGTGGEGVDAALDALEAAVRTVGHDKGEVGRLAKELQGRVSALELRASPDVAPRAGELAPDFERRLRVELASLQSMLRTLVKRSDAAGGGGPRNDNARSLLRDADFLSDRARDLRAALQSRRNAVADLVAATKLPGASPAEIRDGKRDGDLADVASRAQEAAETKASDGDVSAVIRAEEWVMSAEGARCDADAFVQHMTGDARLTRVRATNMWHALRWAVALDVANAERVEHGLPPIGRRDLDAMARAFAAESPGATPREVDLAKSVAATLGASPYETAREGVRRPLGSRGFQLASRSAGPEWMLACVLGSGTDTAEGLAARSSTSERRACGSPPGPARSMAEWIMGPEGSIDRASRSAAAAAERARRTGEGVIEQK